MRAIIISCCLLQGCSAQTLYGVAQGARQNECTKLADSNERARCFEAANRHFDQYIRDQNDKPKE